MLLELFTGNGVETKTHKYSTSVVSLPIGLEAFCLKMTVQSIYT